MKSFIQGDSDALESTLDLADGPRADLPLVVFLHEGLASLDLWRGSPKKVRAATGGLTRRVYSRPGDGRSTPTRLLRPVTYMHHETDLSSTEAQAR